MTYQQSPFKLGWRLGGQSGKDRRRSSLSWLVLLLLFIVSGTTACTTDGDDVAEPATDDLEPEEDASPEDDTQENLPFAVGYFAGALVSLPLLLAEDLGIYDENGLDTDLIAMGSGPEAINAVLSGDLDVTLNSTEAFLFAIEEGHELRFIAGNHEPQVMAVLVRSDYPTPNADRGYPEMVEDLLGSTVGISALGSPTHQTMEAVVSMAGFDPNDIDWVAVGLTSTALPALEEGQIDAYAAFEPAPTMAEDAGYADIWLDLRVGDGPEIFTEWLYNGFGGERSNLESKSEESLRFANALAETIDYINDPGNFDEIVELAGEHLEMEEDLLAQMLDDNLHLFTAELRRTSLENVSEFFADAGAISSAFSYEELVIEGMQ